MGKLGAAMPREEPVAFVADRPFVFAIRHRKTGALLFLGRVADPSKS
jgi:serine protease inhibitor